MSKTKVYTCAVCGTLTLSSAFPLSGSEQTAPARTDRSGRDTPQ